MTQKSNMTSLPCQLTSTQAQLRQFGAVLYFAWPTSALDLVVCWGSLRSTTCVLQCIAVLCCFVP